MNTLEIILLVCALLIVCCWLFRPVASLVWGMFVLVGSVLEMIATGFFALAQGSWWTVKECFRWPPEEVGTKKKQEYTRLFDVFARILYLITGVCALFGALPFDKDRSALLLKMQQVTTIHLPLDLVLSLLWLFIPALAALCVFDLLDWTPSGARLLPHIGGDAQKWLARFSIVLFFLAAIDTVLFYIYGQIPLSFVGTPVTDFGGLGLVVVALLAAVIVCIAVAGFFAIIAGFTGIWIVVGTILTGVFYAIGLVPLLCGYVVVRLGSVLTLPHQPLSLPPVRFDEFLRLPGLPLLSGKWLTQLQEPKKEDESSEQEDEDTVKPIAIPSQGALLMDERIAAYLSIGTRANQMLPAFDEAAHEVGAHKFLRVCGSFSMHAQSGAVISGPTDISPRPSDFRDAATKSTGDTKVQGAKNNQVKLKKLLLLRMANRLANAYSGYNHQPAPIIINLDPYDAEPAEQMIERIASDLPFSSIYVIMPVAEHEWDTPEVQKAFDIIARLFYAGMIAVSSIVDADNYTHADMQKHLAKAVMTLLVLKKQFGPNLSAVEVFELLRRNGSPTTAIRHSSATIIEGPVPDKHWWQRMFGNKGAGELSNMVGRTKELIKTLFEDSSTGSLPCDIDRKKRSVILTFLPLPATEKNKLRGYVQQLNVFVSQSYAPAKAVYARAMGEPNNEELESSYMVGAAWFYSVPISMFRREQELTKIEAPEQPSGLIAPPNQAPAPEPEPEQTSVPDQDTAEKEPEEVTIAQAPALVEDNKQEVSPVDTFMHISKENIPAQETAPNEDGSGTNGVVKTGRRGRPRKQAKSEEEQ